MRVASESKSKRRSILSLIAPAAIGALALSLGVIGLLPLLRVGLSGNRPSTHSVRERLWKRYHDDTFRLLESGRESELPTVEELMEVGRNIEVRAFRDHRTFLGVVGRVVEQCSTRRGERLWSFRERLVSREGHEITVLHNWLFPGRCGEVEALFVCVNGRLWWHTHDDHGTIPWEMEWLESLQGKSPDVRVQGDTIERVGGWPLRFGVSGGYDKGVIDGFRYDIVRDGVRIAVAEAETVSEDRATLKALEHHGELRDGDVVRLPALQPVERESTGDPTIDGGIGGPQSVQGRTPASDGDVEGTTPAGEKE